MNIYEIDNAIASLVDENGEILDFETFEKLSMEKDAKVENMVCWIKDLDAEATAIKGEMDALKDRKTAAENKAHSLRQYVSSILEGGTFKTPKCAVTYRKSTAVEIDDEQQFVSIMKAAGNAEFLTIKEPTANKTAIKSAIASGREVPHCTLVERQNMQVK